jgi:hypothetical protein
MVSINDRTLRITTDGGVHTYQFQTTDELSQALLILSLKGSKKVEFVDEARFNPARFLDCYPKPKLSLAAASRASGRLRKR